MTKMEPAGQTSSDKEIKHRVQQIIIQQADGEERREGKSVQDV